MRWLACFSIQDITATAIEIMAPTIRWDLTIKGLESFGAILARRCLDVRSLIVVSLEGNWNGCPPTAKTVTTDGKAVSIQGPLKVL